MNAQTLQGSWNQVRGKLKEKWGNLTEDDLRLSEGNIDQVIGKIQRRTGEAREAIEKFLDDVTSNGSSAVARAAQAVSDRAGEVCERFRSQMGNMQEYAGEGYQQAQRYLRQNPTQSVAVVFGVGLGLGLLIGLSLRSR